MNIFLFQYHEEQLEKAKYQNEKNNSKMIFTILIDSIKILSLLQMNSFFFYLHPPSPSGSPKNGQHIELYLPVEQISEQQSSSLLQLGS